MANAPGRNPAPGAAPSQATEFRFNKCCGANIQLSEDRRTATRMSDGKGLVVSGDLMMENTVYEVKVLEVDNTESNMLIHLGAAGQISKIKHNRYHDLPSAVAVSPVHVYVNRQQIPMNLGLTESPFFVLKNVGQGSRIGVGLDSRRNLHVFMEDEDLGVAALHTPVTDPCHALFDVSFRLKKVEALPPRRVELEITQQGQQ